jgi:hypothetical protein
MGQGTINGTVRDPSGAVIEGAHLTLTETRTGSSRESTTDSTGSFSFPQLLPGTYAISVSAAGFAAAEQKDIELHVAQNLALEIPLALGQASTQITVTGEELTVGTTSGEVSTLISPREIQETPINGRNFLQLITLAPGVSTAANLNTFQTGLISVTRFSVSGASNDANVYVIDGAQDRDPGGNNVVPLFPSFDAIQEFRVQSNSYGPQYGGAGGAQVNIITRGGGNQFHGSAYDYFRNDKLDANSYFLNQNGIGKSKLRYNNFGYTIGGPIKKDKLFFFWSQEWRRQRRGLTRQGNVPTAAEKVGDFSEDAVRYNAAGCYTASPTPGVSVTTAGGCSSYPIDPNTGKPLGFVAAGQPLDPASAIIPGNELSQAGLTFLKLYPDPTKADAFSGLNYISNPVTPVDTRQENIRVDYSISKDVALLFRYTHDNWVNGAPPFTNGGEGQLWGDDIFPNVTDNWASPATSIAARLTTVKSSWVNTVQYSMSKTFTDISPGPGYAELNDPAVAAIPSFYPHPSERPHMTYWGGAYTSLWHNAPFYNDAHIDTFADDYSKVMGRHTFVAGASYAYGRKNDVVGGGGQTEAGETFGGIGFGSGIGNNSHNPAADFLFRGTTFGFDENSNGSIVNARFNEFEFYAGDTFKATPRLTLNYGFRWSFLRMPYAAKNDIANFIPSLWDPANADDPTDGLAYPGQHGLPRSLVHNANHLIAPRLGFAYDIFGTGHTVLKSGVGEYFGRVQASGQFLALGSNPTFIRNLSGRRFLDVADGFDPAGNPIDTSNASAGRPVKAIDPDLKNPTTWQWNLAVAQQLARNQTLEVAYVGSRSLHQYRARDLNQVLPEFRVDCLEAQLAGTGCGQFRTFNVGLASNGSIQQLSWDGDSVYHSLQARYSARLGRSLINLNYTWSRSIGDIAQSDFGDSAGSYTVTDNSNPRYDRGLSPLDRTHIFIANYIYQFPDLRDRGWLARNVLGGWEVSGVTSYSSGLPLTVFANPGPFDYSVVGQARPDVVPDASFSGPKTQDQWFNTAAFTLADHAAGALGNAPRGVIRGPGIANWDLSFAKNWTLPWFKTSRWADSSQLQFRADLFNAFNHTQFVSVDTNFGASNIVFDSTSNPTKIASYLTNPNFGHVTSTRDPREIQLALRLIF